MLTGLEAGKKLNGHSIVFKSDDCSIFRGVNGNYFKIFQKEHIVRQVLHWIHCDEIRIHFPSGAFAKAFGKIYHNDDFIALWSSKYYADFHVSVKEFRGSLCVEGLCISRKTDPIEFWRTLRSIGDLKLLSTALEAAIKVYGDTINLSMIISNEIIENRLTPFFDFRLLTISETSEESVSESNEDQIFYCDLEENPHVKDAIMVKLREVGCAES
ncbi:hypothetical protein C943_04180 [Mariniradius saccharolyticus AK6]|uniref:Uncharacterized protein n=1 Tax=Mariniradius saccharolyticus AK6 TaxID=1239962 RepID=M7Y9M4_9BACT|nr:hypothetical protein C943_04180 [Mariniradius saccharolyticus AK6]